MNREAPTIVRVGISTVVLGVVMFSPFLFVGIVVLIKAPEQLPTVLFLCALYPALVYLISAPKVILEPGKLTYRWLLKRGTVDLPAVRRACVTAHNIAPTLELHSGHHAPTFNFIIKPFSVAGIAAILKHVRKFSADVEFDKICNDLLHGVTREVLTVQNLVRLAVTVGGAIFLAASIRDCSH